MPGAVVARVSAAGVESVDAFGCADLVEQRAAAADTAYHLYSGTKLFTASTVMRLAERGDLDIDADVRGACPDLPLATPVTPRQLMSHSSGLKDTLRGFFAIHFPGEHRPSTGEALQRYALDRGGPPGRAAAYRNVNYALLGELVARIAGRPYEDVVRTELLEPWGSRASFASAEVPNLATGYVRRFDAMRVLGRILIGARGAAVFGDPVNGYVSLRPFDLDTAAAGGLLGTVADFAPLVVEFLGDGDGVLRADTRRAMLTRVAEGAAGVTSTLGVGLGWKLGEVDGVRFWNHEGGGPGFCSETRIYPAQSIGFVMLANLSQSRRLSRVLHAVSEVYRRDTRPRA